MSFVSDKCTLRISLAAECLATPCSPEDLILCIHRLSYLSAHYAAIQRHFGEFAPSMSASPADAFLTFQHRVLLDIVGESGRGHEHLELIARFTEPKRNKEFLISYRPAIAFASLFLNQIKVALSIRGKGTSQFNVLSKECVDELQAIAVGVTDSNEDQSSIENFLHSFTSVFPKVEGISGSGVAAVKLYHLRGDELDSIVLAVPVERDGRSTTVRDVSSEFRLCGSCWTHGILLSEDTPIEFLQNQCYYADGFVHLVVLNS